MSNNSIAQLKVTNCNKKGAVKTAPFYYERLSAILLFTPVTTASFATLTAFLIA